MPGEYVGTVCTECGSSIRDEAAHAAWHDETNDLNARQAESLKQSKKEGVAQSKMTRAKGKAMSKFNPAAVPTTPVADSPHKRPSNTDPRVDGPYLDDVHAEQENAYRDFRNMSEKKRKEHNRNAASSGTVVEFPENRPNTRELTKEEVKALGQYDSEPKKRTTTKKTTATKKKTSKRVARKRVAKKA